MGKEKKRKYRLIQELLYFFSFPTANVDNKVIDWALCYTSPRILRKLISALADERSEKGALGLIKQIDPSLLLPREHITPDFQRFQRSFSRPKTALVCFTGNGQKLNIPVQLFHILVIRTFDLVVYLRDDNKQQFIHGIPGLGTSLEELGGALQRIIPQDCHIAILSTSSGGLAASRIAEELCAHRMALFSPGFTFKKNLAIKDITKTSSENVRLFFARNHSGDAKLAELWKKSHLSDSIQWLETSTHGTLAHLVYAGNFRALAQWLAGPAGVSSKQ